MANLGNRIAQGALWMLALNVLASSIGIVSTIILARLLLPADFGIIAMAMSFVAILELLWSFGFDSALIQNQQADRKAYDTAWTLNIGLGLTIATALLLVAYPAAAFYGEPRLVPLITCLAAGAVFQGFENVGVIAFRKELRFGSEFAYQLMRKVIGFCITIPLAFALQSFWALAIGIVGGRLASAALSYLAHPFRPRFSLAERKNLLGFSKWLFANNLLFVMSIRSQDFVIGKLSGPTGLGLYTLAYEISNMPVTNLVYPINRAVFPGFSRMATEDGALSHGYRQVVGMIALIAAPAGIGIAAVAEWLIPLVLGERWAATIPIVKVLAIYGTFAALSSGFGPVFMALGKPRVLTLFTLVNLALFIPAVVTGALYADVIGAAWGCLAVVSIMMPLSHWLAARALGISLAGMMNVLWRPLVAAAMMYWLVTTFVTSSGLGGETTLAQAGRLLAAVAIGVAAYHGALLLLWVAAGRPAGAERYTLSLLRRQTRRSSPIAPT
jgi:lipopolysaccharide exporter